MILDQFEELIRDAPSFTKKLFTALATLVNITNIKVIISLRTEQKHELEPLERLIPPFAATSVVLEDVDDQHIPDVIDSGNIEARRRWGREAITDVAAAEIHSWWAAARKQDDLIKELPPGLLTCRASLRAR